MCLRSLRPVFFTFGLNFVGAILFCQINQILRYFKMDELRVLISQQIVTFLLY